MPIGLVHIRQLARGASLSRRMMRDEMMRRRRQLERWTSEQTPALVMV